LKIVGVNFADVDNSNRSHCRYCHRHCWWVCFWLLSVVLYCCHWK